MHEEDFELTFDLGPLEQAEQPQPAAQAAPVPGLQRPSPAPRRRTGRLNRQKRLHSPIRSRRPARRQGRLRGLLCLSGGRKRPVPPRPQSRPAGSIRLCGEC